MDAIRDDDLILYHYDDGLPPARRAAIAAALQQSAALRARYAQLCATLQAVDAEPAPAPDAGFEQRLWQRWEQQLDAAPPRAAAMPPQQREPAGSRRSPRPRHLPRRGQLLRRAGAVLALVLALGLGFLLGRQPGVAPPPAPPQANARGDLSTRVLDAYVVAHLRETESLVLTAVNSDNDALLAGNRELAASLFGSNRLYAEAAARAGNQRLASFLRQLEPLLIELANPAGAAPVQDSDGLRNYVDKTDLLFQLRAAQARIEPQRPTSI